MVTIDDYSTPFIYLPLAFSPSPFTYPHNVNKFVLIVSNFTCRGYTCYLSNANPLDPTQSQNGAFLRSHQKTNSGWLEFNSRVHYPKWYRAFQALGISKNG